jgi:hypothetical protein
MSYSINGLVIMLQAHVFTWNKAVEQWAQADHAQSTGFMEAPQGCRATLPIQVIVQRSVKAASDTQAVLIAEQDARRQFRDSPSGS